MNGKHNTLYKIFTIVGSLVFVLGMLVWIQASVSPAAAQEPDTDVGLTVRIEHIGDELGLAAADSIPVFNVGDQFEISIVAVGVPDPGIFGSQFQVNFEAEVIQALDGTLASGPALEPVVMVVKNVDNGSGLISWAASRQGNVENVAGDVVLATLTLEAAAPTEPPEGQTTSITLDNVKLGAKGGISVPVNGLQGLDVIIRDDGTIPGKGDMAGVVMVEGRAEDNQAGHSVTAAGAETEFVELTDEFGLFHFNNLPEDSYTMTADSPGFLAATCESVVHTMGALTELADVTLLAGDIDGGGVIDITDAVAIGTAFGSTEPEIADLNADGVVDILDLILMAANYDQTSAANPWVCQLPAEL